jgi:GAF domain-containing protein/HAMP domain-containing protein
MTQLNSLPAEDEKLRDSAFRITAIFLGATVLTIPVILFLAWQTGAWQLYTVTGVLVVLGILHTAIVQMIRRGRYETGGWLFIATVLGALLISMFLIANLGVTVAIISVILTFVIANQSLPTRSIRQALIVGVAAGLLSTVPDLLNLDYRLSVPALNVYVPTITTIIVIVAGIIVARQSWNVITIAWKMLLMVLVLFLGTLGVATAGYNGLQSLRYQLSNIYDFMLVPIVAINNADAALAKAQYLVDNLKQVSGEQLTKDITSIQADNKLAEDTITRYDIEWVTTTSSDFTKSLQDAGKLELQKQELAALGSFHTAFDEYKVSIDKYLATVQAGKPDATLASDALQKLQTAQTSLQALIDVNNSYAEFSNGLAQTAFQQSLIIGVTVLIIGLVLGLFLSYLVVVSIITRLGVLTRSAASMQEGNLDQVVDVTGRDEISLLGRAFNSMTSQLKGLFGTLEQRVAERTQSLELASEVGRSVSQVRALDVMLKDATELIRSRFDLYYVQVYLTDPSQTNLLLFSGTGKVGAELLSRSHRLPLNTSSINGRAATEKKSVVISDTTTSTTFRPNPLLPNTRSEMAVPLLVGDKVVGVLDLQSEKANSLNQEILSAFEALAGQLAIAIQNATLLAETNQARAELEAQARRLVRTNWADYMDAIHKPEETGFVFEQNQISAMTQDETIKVNSLVAPISVTGESLGSLVVEMAEQATGARNAELVNTIALQVAQHIESLRLLESAERYRAEAEEASRRITREGWKTYVENAEESLSYFYDLKEVRTHDGNGKDESATSVPLKVRDEILGRLTIEGLDANDSQSLELANAVAERLSAHIESLRQFEETRRGQIELDKRAQQLAAVAEISTVSSKELDINKMLESVVNLSQRQFGLYHAHIFTYNENTQQLEISACGWEEGSEHSGTHEKTVIALSQEQSLVARAARTKQPIIVNDVRNEPGWLPNPLLPDTASELAVPLLIGDQILGVLDVQSDRINAFTEEDANIQTTLASQVATALQNARSFARAQQQADRESTLNVISQKIQSATSVEAVLQIAARELGHALGAPMTIAQLSMKDKS